ncbi:MAG: hypothetical protein CH6_1869 [Candidatus Kapaibacterium sp.]|nr:MAG: hypothetical protein CH6_1869 [Candidatus Kapabacteria bacterium]
MNNNVKLWSLLFIVLLVIPLIISIYTNFWGISAISVGLLFGFALQKGDLCGSSSMSEVLLFKDYSKIFGLWVAIVSSMVFFAILQLLGVVELAPKKFIWLNALVGGFVFGFGTVLAGGCISGCLYKASAGNINSFVALLTIPIGIAAVDYGFLKPLQDYLLQFVINHPDGKPLTLYSVLGVPYWVLVILFVIITIWLGYLLKKKVKENQIKLSKEGNSITRFITRPWKPWQSGIAIGMIGMLAWLSSLPTGRNYPLGVTHGVSYISKLLLKKMFKLLLVNRNP